MERNTRMWETVVPFMAMVLMEGCTIALTVTANTSMENGMNQFVFVSYSNALSSLILLPYSYFFHKHKEIWRTSQIFSCKLLPRLFLLGFTGICMAQNLAFTGLRYSSPIVVCAMGLLLPCFQFFLALLQRKTKLDLTRASGKVRVAGILVSLTGAAVVATYKGPYILQDALIKPRLLHATQQPLFVFVSTSQQWLLGCLLLASSTFFVAVWSNLQVSTLKMFPDMNMMAIVSWYIQIGTVQTMVVDLVAEHELSAWKLSMNLELAIIVLTAVFGTFVKSRVQAWCMSTKGVMYVSLFKPFGIFWACSISLSLFGRTLHYGSVMGAAVSGIGYYAMLWGAKKEEEEEKTDELNKPDSVYEDHQLKAPLLQQGEDQV